MAVAIYDLNYTAECAHCYRINFFFLFSLYMLGIRTLLLHPRAFIERVSLWSRERRSPLYLYIVFTFLPLHAFY